MRFSDISILDMVVTISLLLVYHHFGAWASLAYVYSRYVDRWDIVGSQRCSIAWCSVTWKFHIFWIKAVFGLYFSPYFAVPELPWPVITFMPVWVTGQLEQAVLFLSLWRSLSALKGRAPCRGHLIFFNLCHFPAQIFGFFGGVCVCVSKPQELCWNSYFISADGKFTFMFSGMTRRNQELFLHDLDPPL